MYAENGRVVLEKDFVSGFDDIETAKGDVLLVAEARHNLPVMPILAAGGAAGLTAAVQRLPRLTAAMRSGGTLVRRS